MKAVTGAMIYYHYVCDRKLWYFSHQLDMEHTSDLVQIGKLIDEESYSREKKHIMVDDMISIDFLQSWRIVHEVKKSRSVEIASIWQLKYYMWILENKGIEIEKGILKITVAENKQLMIDTKTSKILLFSYPSPMPAEYGVGVCYHHKGFRVVCGKIAF